MDYKPITREEKYGKGWMGDKNYKKTVIQRYREQRKRKSEVVITNIQDIMRIDEDYRKKMDTVNFCTTNGPTRTYEFYSGII